MIEWMEGYRIGHTEIDAHQQQLFDLTNRMLATQDVATLRQLLQELYRNACDHFALEERLMDELGYPGVDAHRQAHRRTLDRLDILCMDVGKGMLNKRGIEALMREWAEKHVPGEDAVFGHYLAQRPQA